MEMENAPSSAGALLCEFLRADDEIRSERSLALLFSNYAEPQVRRMLRRKMSVMGVVERQDLDDVCSHVLLDLLRHLRHLQENNDNEPIQDFGAYTSTITYRGYSDYLRRKYPRRYRLKVQVRELFRSDKRFEVWQSSQNEWICGLATTHRTKGTANLQEIRELCSDFVRGNRPSEPAEFVAEFLKRIDAPVELDDLVGLIAEFWGVRDATAADLEEARSVPMPSAEKEVIDVRRRLEKLWAQVCLLPVRQRHALLLNLRDGKRGSALTLLPAIGIASVLSIAAALEVSNNELRSIWNELPLDDNQIARRLEIQRQQVINLRKSARARLARRTS
jgi:hypothetical protein